MESSRGNSETLLVESYAKASKVCTAQLKAVWLQLALTVSEQQKELDKTACRAEEVWERAVQLAQEQQTGVQDQIAQALRDIDSIREELGIDMPPKQAPAGRTLQAALQDVTRDLDHWESQKEHRSQEIHALEAESTVLRARIGGHHTAVRRSSIGNGRTSISKESLELVQMDCERLKVETERRSTRLTGMLEDLKALAKELGESAEQAASSAHPSLAAPTRTPERRASAVIQNWAVDRIVAAADLNDHVFNGLQAAIVSFQQLKAEREGEAEVVSRELDRLWAALDMPVVDVDRAALTSLLEGPWRLHSVSIEKSMREVERLEKRRVQVAKDTAWSKRRAVEALCADGHIAAPPYPHGFQEALQQGNEVDFDLVEEVMARLDQQHAEVEASREHRGIMLEAARKLDAACEDVAWLTAFEHDEDRYKGRDANRNLQRAIKVQKVRDKLPAMIQHTYSLLADWYQREGQPFMYDGQDYQTEVLNGIAEDVEREALQRQQQVEKKQASKRAGTAPSTPSRRAAPASRRSSMVVHEPSTPSRTPSFSGRATPSRMSKPPASVSSLSFRDASEAQSKPPVTPLNVREHTNRANSSPEGTPTLSGPLQDKLNRLMQSSSPQGGPSPAGSTPSPFKEWGIKAHSPSLPHTPHNTPSIFKSAITGRKEQRGGARSKMTLQIPQPQFSSQLSSPIGADANRQGHTSGHTSPTDGAAALRRSITSVRSKIPRPARGMAGSKGSSIPQHVSVMVPDAATKKGSSPAHSPSVGSNHASIKAGTPSPPSSALARTRSV
ncbi:hypothetical protein WJX74_004838 [Apatococcus lobatus]|uniref:Uncharacterized protein n=1 Tax=Apatococcus lobatus TaxID=904363 RepID=A0AAW1S1G2_9CHLO